MNTAKLVSDELLNWPGTKKKPAAASHPPYKRTHFYYNYTTATTTTTFCHRIKRWSRYDVTVYVMRKMVFLEFSSSIFWCQKYKSNRKKTTTAAAKPRRASPLLPPSATPPPPYNRSLSRSLARSADPTSGSHSAKEFKEAEVGFVRPHKFGI